MAPPAGTRTKSKQQVEIVLENTYIDKVTGFSGIATGRFEQIGEPTQVLLENDISQRWLAEHRLELVHEAGK